MTAVNDLTGEPDDRFEAWLAAVEARPAVNPDDDAREDAQRGHFERVPDYEDAVERLIGISLWIDEANAHRHPDTNLWSRVSKAAEEGGEAMDALRGFLGENPRKGQTCGIEDVVSELLDTAVSALGAVEHITGHDGSSFARLVEHIEYVHGRMQESAAAS